MPPDLRIAAVRTVWAAGYGRRAGKPDQNDAGRIRNHPAHRSARLHTGGMCHLDADMSRQGMAALEAEADNALDFIILENVGNLVCPAEFDTGACLNVAILSVPEGDDKPLKYPLMFEKCQVVIINKIDSMPAFDFDRDWIGGVDGCGGNGNHAGKTVVSSVVECGRSDEENRKGRL